MLTRHDEAMVGRTQGPPLADPSAGRRSVRSLWAAAVLGGLAQSLAGTAGALLARKLGGSDAVAGLPQAMLVVGSVVSALGLSALTRRRGRGVALSTGAVVAVAGCIAVVVAALSSSVVGVLLGSLLLGSGSTTVMLGRYAAAELGPEASRARALASVLAATAVGAVAGPNLLSPASAVAADLGMPELVGPYLVAAVGFTAAAVVLGAGLGTGRPLPAATSAHAGAAATGPAGSALGRQGTAGIAVLSLANLVMVSVMTMTPVQLHHHGVGLGTIGLVVSGHIAGMFVPSVLSGWLTERIGAGRVAGASGALLMIACPLAASGAASSTVLCAAMVLLGIGWNLGLVAGSVLLITDVPVLDRPRREGWGEVGMGAAAAGGGATSGVIVAASGYATLVTAAAAFAALLLPFAWHGVAGWSEPAPKPVGTSHR